MMKSSNINNVCDVSGLEQSSLPTQNSETHSNQEKVTFLKSTSLSNEASPYEFSAKFLNNNNTKEQSPLDEQPYSQSGNVAYYQQQVDENESPSTSSSLASVQLSVGLLRLYEPPLVKARSHLKELIAKQNKIYIDLTAEKFKLDNADIVALQTMMNGVKIYKEKLVKIKKQMQNIYQRTKNLKKRALNVQTSKQKELQRKLQKQQQEEALIGRQMGTSSSHAGSSTSSTIYNHFQSS